MNPDYTESRHTNTQPERDSLSRPCASKRSTWYTMIRMAIILRIDFDRAVHMDVSHRIIEEISQIDSINLFLHVYFEKFLDNRIIAVMKDVNHVLIMNVWLYLSILIPWNTRTLNTDEFPVPPEFPPRYWKLPSVSKWHNRVSAMDLSVINAQFLVGWCELAELCRFVHWCESFHHKYPDSPVVPSCRANVRTQRHSR